MKITKQGTPPQIPRPKLVAAYARVSSGKDSMMNSLSAQVSYYSDYIQRHIEWRFAGIYADAAATGTKGSRPEFQRMLEDCRAGKIDMVITKSITRFARNTVTTLETVRELKLLGIDVYFQKENIRSLSGDGELMLSILASYAQEESRNVSENCKWRIRNLFREGKAGGMKMLGYRLDKGRLVIVPEEALVVRAIFEDYLSGMGLSSIAEKCRGLGVKASRGGLYSLLRNEKYQGDMLLQKRYTTDHLTKCQIKNTGQLPQYHVQNSHEPIIGRDTFAAVQTEIARRAALCRPKKHSAPAYPFTGLIRCGMCGASYKRKHTAAGTKYEKIVWICPTYNELGKAHCGSRQIPESILLQKASEAGGLDNIAEIRIPCRNRLTFIYKDSRTIDVNWENPSRRESWTPAMKQAAREQQLKILEGRRNE